MLVVWGPLVVNVMLMPWAVVVSGNLAPMDGWMDGHVIRSRVAVGCESHVMSWSE